MLVAAALASPRMTETYRRPLPDRARSGYATAVFKTGVAEASSWRLSCSWAVSDAPGAAVIPRIPREWLSCI